MTTFVYTHPACLEHDTGPGHPERPARLETVLSSLRTSEFADIQWREAPSVDPDVLALVHPAEHVAAIMDRLPERGVWNLDADTIVSPGSGEAALRAAGAICAAIDAVMEGSAQNAFCATRPPGHHAGRDQVEGFCLFNNAAIGAAYAREKYKLDRVAIIDFDVHHGNGTQDIFWNDPHVFYGSTHQSPLYPGTGANDERGAHENIANVPLMKGTDSETFRSVFEQKLLSRLTEFAPGLIIVSAGFDAHKADPLGGLKLDESDFSWISQKLLKVADQCCKGKLVGILEGGYNVEALGKSVASYVKAMLDHEPHRPEPLAGAIAKRSKPAGIFFANAMISSAHSASTCTRKVLPRSTRRCLCGGPIPIWASTPLPWATVTWLPLRNTR